MLASARALVRSMRASQSGRGYYDQTLLEGGDRAPDRHVSAGEYSHVEGGAGEGGAGVLTLGEVQTRSLQREVNPFTADTDPAPAGDDNDLDLPIVETRPEEAGGEGIVESRPAEGADLEFAPERQPAIIVESMPSANDSDLSLAPDRAPSGGLHGSSTGTVIVETRPDVNVTDPITDPAVLPPGGQQQQQPSDPDQAPPPGDTDDDVMTPLQTCDGIGRGTCTPPAGLEFVETRTDEEIQSELWQPVNVSR